MVFCPCCPLRDYSLCMVLFHHQVQQSNDLPSHCVTGFWILRHARECPQLRCGTHWRQQSEFTHFNAEKKTTIKIDFLQKLQRIAMKHHNPLIKKYLHFFFFFLWNTISSDRVFSFCFIEHIWCRICFYEFDVIRN